MLPKPLGDRAISSVAFLRRVSFTNTHTQQQQQPQNPPPFPSPPLSKSSIMQPSSSPSSVIMPASATQDATPPDMDETAAFARRLAVYQDADMIAETVHDICRLAATELIAHGCDFNITWDKIVRKVSLNRPDVRTDTASAPLEHAAEDDDHGK